MSHGAPTFAVKAMGYSINSNLIFDEHGNRLEKIFNKFRPRIWFYAHYHKSFRKELFGCQFVALDSKEWLPNVDLPVDPVDFSFPKIGDVNFQLPTTKVVGLQITKSDRKV